MKLGVRLIHVVQVGTVGEVQIEKPVIVIVDPGAAGTGGFHDRTELLLAEGMFKVNSGCCCPG